MKKLANTFAILLLLPLQASLAEFDDREEKWTPDFIEVSEDIFLLPNTQDTEILNPTKPNDFAKAITTPGIHADSYCFLDHEKSRRLRKLSKGTRFKVAEISKSNHAFAQLAEFHQTKLKAKIGEIPEGIKTVRDANLLSKKKLGQYLFGETQYTIALSRLKKAKNDHGENEGKSTPKETTSERSENLYCFLKDEEGLSLDVDSDQIFRILAKYSPLVPLQNEDAEE